MRTPRTPTTRTHRTKRRAVQSLQSIKSETSDYWLSATWQDDDDQWTPSRAGIGTCTRPCRHWLISRRRRWRSQPHPCARTTHTRPTRRGRNDRRRRRSFAPIRAADQVAQQICETAAATTPHRPNTRQQIQTARGRTAHHEPAEWRSCARNTHHACAHRRAALERCSDAASGASTIVECTRATRTARTARCDAMGCEAIAHGCGRQTGRQAITSRRLQSAALRNRDVK